jgi:hypothetical protein
MSAIPYKSTSNLVTQGMLLAGAKALQECAQAHHYDQNNAAAVCLTLWNAMHNAAPELQGDLGAWSRTISGKRIVFAAPDPDAISIKDIAAGLAKVNRFNGQTTIGYTVAQHSWWVSTIVPPEHALQALLHDASEAYLSDLASPAKQLCHDYRQLEALLNNAIMQRFNLPAQHHPEVKKADLIMLATEKQDLMPLAAEEEWPILQGIKPYPLMGPLMPLDADQAENLFLKRFDQLIGREAA